MNKGKHLIISGILFTIVLFIWPVFMALFEIHGTIEQHFNWILNHTPIYKIQFFFAFLLSPSLIYLMFAQLNIYSSNDKITSAVGKIFLSGYLVLNSISYASQMTIVPVLIEKGMIAQAEIWYFNSSFSISYFLNQMGYCFWAIGALVLFYKFITRKGIIKYLSIIYSISAILSIIAFIGLTIENELINSMTIVSGLALIPIGIMSIVLGVKENRNMVRKD